MNTFPVWIIIFLVILIVGWIARRNEKRETANDEEYPRSNLPFSERVKRQMLLMTRSRKMSAHEFMLDPTTALSLIRVLFFVPRRPLEIGISFANMRPASIKSVKGFLYFPIMLSIASKSRPTLCRKKYDIM
jgi:hypothetical protein